MLAGSASQLDLASVRRGVAFGAAVKAVRRTICEADAEREPT